jgi:RIO kinase 1
VIIDVSQAVDLDHPKALDFLREDCAHVNDFFRRRGGPSQSLHQCYFCRMMCHIHGNCMPEPADSCLYHGHHFYLGMLSCRVAPARLQ